tara:strand:+ start:4853 stop:5647 length:795 start_codon:yes stop_codon:yes gene_type:complete
MENKHVIALLPDYIDGILDAKQHNAITVHLKNCEHCSKELLELNVLFKAFKNEVIHLPSKSLKINFHEAIANEKQEMISGKKDTFEALHPHRKLWTWAKIAASIVFLISAFLVGRYYNPSTSNPIVSVPTNDKGTSEKKIMLALMDDLSASKRIQGVTTVNEFENPDKTIVNALIERMLYDQNTNVRLTAVQALIRFTSSEAVKNGFVKALKSEKDPLVQIRIIKTLVKIQEKKALVPMRHLLEQKDTEPFVKEQLKLVIPTIL